MLLHLTDLSSEPLHHQIYRQVRALILAGDLKSGESLPSIRALARDGRVSVITVQRAYDDLDREGLIVAHRGKGFFVAEISIDSRKLAASARFSQRISDATATAISEGLSGEEIIRAVETTLSEIIPLSQDNR